MKTVDIVILVTLAAIPVACVYKQSPSEEGKVYPIVGAAQVVRAIRYMDGMPNATQVSTDKGEFLVTRFVEIPLHSPVVVRQKNDDRVLCMAPSSPEKDIKTLPCWKLESQPVEVTP